MFKGLNTAYPRCPNSGKLFYESATGHRRFRSEPSRVNPLLYRFVDLRQLSFSADFSNLHR